MSILRRIGPALALVWQIIRLSLPEKPNRTYVGAFVLVGVLGTTVAVFYATSPRPLKISEYDTGGGAALETPKAPTAKETGPVAPTGPVIDPSRLGSRFPYPSPEKSPFEVAGPGPIARTPSQGPAKPSVVTQAEKAPSPSPASGRASPEYKFTQYKPTFSVGSAKLGDAKNTLIVIWSHAAPDLKAMADLLRSFKAEIASKRLLVILFQVVGNDKKRLNEAAVFLCAPEDKYARFVFAYLDQSQRYANDYAKAIMTIGQGFGLPNDPEPCLAGRAGAERILTLDGYEKALRKEWSYTKLPAYILNGYVIEPKEIRHNLRPSARNRRP